MGEVSNQHSNGGQPLKAKPLNAASNNAVNAANNPVCPKPAATKASDESLNELAGQSMAAGALPKQILALAKRLYSFVNRSTRASGSRQVLDAYPSPADAEAREIFHSVDISADDNAIYEVTIIDDSDSFPFQQKGAVSLNRARDCVEIKFKDPSNGATTLRLRSEELADYIRYIFTNEIDPFIDARHKSTERLKDQNVIDAEIAALDQYTNIGWYKGTFHRGDPSKKALFEGLGHIKDVRGKKVFIPSAGMVIPQNGANARRKHFVVFENTLGEGYTGTTYTRRGPALVERDGDTVSTNQRDKHNLYRYGDAEIVRRRDLFTAISELVRGNYLTHYSGRIADANQISQRYHFMTSNHSRLLSLAGLHPKGSPQTSMQSVLKASRQAAMSHLNYAEWLDSLGKYEAKFNSGDELSFVREETFGTGKQRAWGLAYVNDFGGFFTRPHFLIVENNRKIYYLKFGLNSTNSYTVVSLAESDLHRGFDDSTEFLTEELKPLNTDDANIFRMIENDIVLVESMQPEKRYRNLKEADPHNRIRKEYTVAAKSRGKFSRPYEAYAHSGEEVSRTAENQYKVAEMILDPIENFHRLGNKKVASIFRDDNGDIFICFTVRKLKWTDDGEESYINRDITLKVHDQEFKRAMTRVFREEIDGFVDPFNASIDRDIERFRNKQRESEKDRNTAHYIQTSGLAEEKRKAARYEELGIYEGKVSSRGSNDRCTVYAIGHEKPYDSRDALFFTHANVSPDTDYFGKDCSHEGHGIEFVNSHKAGAGCTISSFQEPVIDLVAREYDFVEKSNPPRANNRVFGFASSPDARRLAEFDHVMNKIRSFGSGDVKRDTAKCLEMALRSLDHQRTQALAFIGYKNKIGGDSLFKVINEQIKEAAKETSTRGARLEAAKNDFDSFIAEHHTHNMKISLQRGEIPYGSKKARVYGIFTPYGMKSEPYHILITEGDENFYLSFELDEGGLKLKSSSFLKGNLNRLEAGEYGIDLADEVVDDPEQLRDSREINIMRTIEEFARRCEAEQPIHAS